MTLRKGISILVGGLLVLAVVYIAFSVVPAQDPVCAQPNEDPRLFPCEGIPIITFCRKGTCYWCYNEETGWWDWCNVNVYYWKLYATGTVTGAYYTPLYHTPGSCWSVCATTCYEP